MTKEEINESIDRLDNLWKTSQLNEAKEFAETLLESVELQSNQELLAKVHNILGNIFILLSDTSKSLQQYNVALKINMEIDNKFGIAGNIGNIGLIYMNSSDFTKAFEYFEKAISLYQELGYQIGVASFLGNLGLMYTYLSDIPKALEYYGKAIKINEENENLQGYANNLANIGLVYLNLLDYPKSLHYFEQALPINEKIGNKIGIANLLGNIGNIYRSLLEFSQSKEYYEKALFINEEIGNRSGIASNISNLGNLFFELADYANALEQYKKSLQINEEIGNKSGIASNLGNVGSVYKNLSEYSTALEYLQQSNVIANEIVAKNILMDNLKEFSEIYEQMGEINLAFSYFKQYIEIKDGVYSEDSTIKAQLFDQRRKIEEDEKARQLKLARFQEQEKILHNILPVNIADRILKHETFIADHFHSVSVLFMDLVGFTSLATIAPPKQLVFLLDSIFQKADEVLDQFGLEKIKTIGDGYLAVANVTTPLENHQHATADAALQLLEIMKDFVVNIPTDLGDTSWIQNMKDIEIRIGIHTGEVVAGIIGKNKYTYDLWGDAVNVASRMESNSEAGRIHISEEFALSISEYPEFSIVPRGEIHIKGKGTMNTYWLEKAR